MNRSLLSFFGALFALTVSAAPSLDVTANRNQVYLGEAFLLEVRVGGADNPAPPDLSALKNCSQSLLGSARENYNNYFNINGKVRRESFNGRRFTYRLTPTAAGELVTGPITATVDGTALTATGPTINVTGVSKQDLVSVAVSASRDTVLVDEPFDIRLTVKIRQLPGAYAAYDPLLPNDPPHLEAPFLLNREIDGLKGPNFETLLNSRLISQNQPGFSINTYSLPGTLFNPQGAPARFKLDRRPVGENGTACWEYSLTLPFSPLTEGPYTFGPVLFKGNVPVSVNEQGQAQTTPVFAVGAAATVRVISPPEQGRPDSYIGALGSNLVVEASLDAQTCNVGDPLQLTLTLTGAVQMRNITPPKLSLNTNLLNQFEIYDDSVQATRQEGRMQYVYTLRPRRPGSFELPSLDVSFYDVGTRQYRTVATAPIPLKVRQSSEITAAQVIGASTNKTLILHHRDEAAMLPAGIRMDPSASEPASLTGSTGRLLAIALTGPVIFLITLLMVLAGRHLPAFKKQRQQRNALTCAQRQFKSLPNTPDTACAVMRRYLADRLDTRTDSMTPAEARALLAAQGIPADLADRFASLMQQHFDAAFSSAHSEVDTAILSAILSEIEQHLKAAPSRHPAKPLLATLLVLAGVVSLPAATPEERGFVWEQVAAELRTAQSPADFLAASGTCQKLVDLGVRNSALFYNQGTALLLAEKPADAIAVLLRAERYGGSTPDVRRNLAIAQARQDGLKTPEVSWLRLVLFWHYRPDCATRATLAAIAFSGLWLAGVLRLLGSRRTGKALMTVSALMLILFASSVLTTIQQESRIQRPGAMGKIFN